MIPVESQLGKFFVTFNGMKFLSFALFTLLFGTTCVVWGQNSRTDSLEAILFDKQKVDTARFKTAKLLFRDWMFRDPAKARSYIKTMLAVAKTEERKAVEAEAYKLMGITYDIQGEYPDAITQYQKSIALYDELRDTLHVAFAKNNMALTHTRQGSYQAAVNIYLEVLRTKEALLNAGTHTSEELQLGGTYENLGIAYNYMSGAFTKEQNNETSLKYLRLAREFYLESADSLSIWRANSSIAKVLSEMGERKEAITIFEELIPRYQTRKMNWQLSITYGSLATLYLEEGQFEVAEKYARLLKQTASTIQDQPNVAKSQAILGQIALKRDNPDSAILYLERAIPVYREKEDQRRLSKPLWLLSKAYALKGNYDKAHRYHVEHKKVSDSLLNQRNLQIIHEAQTRFESEKKEAENLALRKEKEIQSLQLKRQEQQVLWATLAVALVVVVAALLFHNNRVQRQTNQALQEKNTLINQQKEEISTIAENLRSANEDISHKNEAIMGSIRYASRIQRAILPANERLERLFPSHFLFYRPRDVVSGDFYWVEKVGHRIVLAIADCTGHGVPGALMSMLGSEGLTRIVIQEGETRPAAILERLNTLVVDALRQETTQNRDGMDIALCTLDERENTLCFAGANNPLLLVQDGKAKRIKGDRQAIGGKQRDQMSFTEHCFSLEQPATFYLFSDGFQDQFGGEENTKFMSKRFREFLFEGHELPFEAQHARLDQALQQWMNAANTRQTDDIIVFGARWEI